MKHPQLQVRDNGFQRPPDELDRFATALRGMLAACDRNALKRLGGRHGLVCGPLQWVLDLDLLRVFAEPGSDPIDRMDGVDTVVELEPAVLSMLLDAGDRVPERGFTLLRGNAEDAARLGRLLMPS